MDNPPCHARIENPLTLGVLFRAAGLPTLCANWLIINAKWRFQVCRDDVIFYYEHDKYS